MTSTMGFGEITSRNLKELDQTMKTKIQSVDVQTVVMVDISDPERKVTCGETVLPQYNALDIMSSSSLRHTFSMKSHSHNSRIIE